MSKNAEYIDGNIITPVQAKKQLDIIQRKTGMIAILVFEHIYSYNMSRLVAQKINFVIPNKQMFMPSLLLDLKTVNTIDVESRTDSVSPLTQCLLLYHLEKESISGKTSYELADKLTPHQFIISKKAVNIATAFNRNQ